MQTMWAGRFQKQLDADVNDFNSSISFDARMFRQDIAGSLAHVAMLAKAGILTDAERDAIAAGLGSILDDIASGALPIDPAAEDIHMFVEAELTKRIGDVGKKLHTARSRNDQVALDLRLCLMDEIGKIESEAKTLLKTLLDQAEAYAATILPGYTHLQRAQPITFGHHLMAYANMIERDLCRLAACKKSAAVSPLGCCALAGTTYPTDRAMTAAALGCAGPCENSMDGVSDRDFVIELASCIAILMMHLSRFSEEIILWCSWEFHFIELDDAYSTGSSIMPQKKNPDIPELVRGKAGRSYGNLIQPFFLHIKRFAAQRQDRLKAPVAPLFCAAACRVALHDEKFIELRVSSGTTGKLSDKRCVFKFAFLARHAFRFACCFAHVSGFHSFFRNFVRRIRIL